ncbi:MAG: iron complex transport system substrate-binding protein [Halanaerobium sp. 4-GBenrich]|uniref:Iron complex transport system substrate-binding protein n=1 Tax=Halanaerobium congolense TaxID=54121 RepID=A0A1G6JN56_9FIRM|nr:iron ABC transporter substrate-binding protein [Halanaerobium congolense]ODS49786.1 MAG: iron complex transport system substrate-binding protein [Halanaerobium sp. 4-GBenrich]PUU93468.1 MAG: iron complex transport system substrate-binding protein [Halanaerobium sp.]PXV61052.1 iron complex transport system substrate-binding protein [Halanaerobium congolense]TDP25909.1 iron complex transport system substrate-binding protein [Halanaerobium congolense]TDS23879.1 iron complex transport system su
MDYLKQIKVTIILSMLIILIFPSSINAIEISDLAGRKLNLPDEIEKIAAVGPGALRLVVYLEAEDKVVGVEEFEKRNQKRPYIIAKPELLELPVIGPQFGGDAELITAQNPDLIIASYLSRAEMDSLQTKTQIPVVSINDGSPGSMTEKELKTALNFLAKILDKEKRAEELINFFNQSKVELQAKTGDLESDLRLYIGGIGNKGAQGISSTESNYPPFKYLGLKNIIEEKDKSNFSISKERLLLEDPDLIFIDQGGLKLVKNDLKRKEFRYLKAYQQNNIYQLLPYNHYTSNFATMLADAYYIAKILYPEKFKEVEPKEKADQIYQKFVGKPVYNEMADIFGGFKKMNLN